MRFLFNIDKNNSFKIDLYASVFIVIASFLIYFFPLIYFGENAVVRINDCLDGDFVYRIVLAKSHTMFAFNPMAPVNNIMNGLPRACLPSGLNIYQWIVFLFPNFYGFLINYVITHSIGFAGMFFFLRNHIIKEKSQKSLALLVSFVFTILPFYGITGLAVIGIPLLANALLCIMNGQEKTKHYLALLLYSFYCFYNMFPIIIIGVAILFIWDFIKNKKINKKLLFAISLVSFCLLLSEYQIIYVFVFHKIIPQRLVEHFKTSLNYKGVFIETLITLCNGIISSANYPVYIVGLSVLLIILCYLFYKPIVSLPIKLLLLVFIVSFGVAIWDWYPLQFLYDKYTFFNMFSFKRINCFLPFLVYSLLAASMALVEQKTKWLKFILMPIIIFSTLKINYTFDHSDNSDMGKLTYHQFFSEKLFKEIDTYIGKPKQNYRICDVGLLPSIAQYNGFYTLDGYQYLFPMSYRLQFIKIIQGELNKSAGLTDFLNSPSGGPNVCFTFSAEEYDSIRVAGKHLNFINNMALDHQALKALNCQYIFSLYPIKKFTSDSIVFDKEFINTEAPFNIYLYKVL